MPRRRDAKERVRLDPHALVKRVITFVERVNDAEYVLSLDHTLQDLGHVRALLITNAVNVESRRSDDPEERISTRSKCRLDDVEQRPVRMRMQLVQDPDVGVPTVLC